MVLTIYTLSEMGDMGEVLQWVEVKKEADDSLLSKECCVPRPNTCTRHQRRSRYTYVLHTPTQTYFRTQQMDKYEAVQVRIRTMR